MDIFKECCINQHTPNIITLQINYQYSQCAGKQHPQFAYGNQRVLTNHIELLAISQSQYGEEIKPGSVEILIDTPKVESKVLKIVDDGYGNLVESTRCAKILLLNNETGEIHFSDFDGNEYHGTTDLTNFESGSLNVLTIAPQGGADTRATRYECCIYPYNGF